MKLLSYIRNLNFLAVTGTLFCIALLSCSSHEEIDIPGSDEENPSSEAGIYFNLKVALPSTTGTRASTTSGGGSSEGTDPGVYNENVVGDFRLEFYTQNDDYTDVSKILELGTDALKSENKIDFNTSSASTKLVSYKVTVEQLKSLRGKELYVYFIGNNNNNNGLGTFINKENPFKTYNYDVYGNEYWNWSHRFGSADGRLGLRLPVINHDEFKVNFEGITIADIDILEKGYDESNATEYSDVLKKVEKNINNIFNNKTLQLERINARFDYAETGSTNHIFPLINGDEDCKVFVKINSLTPINVTKYAYLYRHTAPGDAESASYTEGTGYSEKLFGIENGDGDGYTWVISSDAQYKRAMAENWNPDLQDEYNGSNKKYYDHFSNYAKTDNTLDHKEYDPTPVTELFNEGSYSYSITENGKTRTYYPWRYVPENTLPSTEAMIRGLSTGIMFEVYLCDKDGTPYSTTDAVKTALEGLYAGKEVSITPDGTDRYTLKVGDEETIMTAVKTDGAITAFALNYFYFIQHNIQADHTPGVMAPMQFGVVRNNIYRISVAGFNGLPLPYNPTDPDEPETKCDINIELRVKGWEYHWYEMNW